MNKVLKYLGVDMAKAGMDSTHYAFWEVKMRRWWNPMRWIKGKFYYENLREMFTPESLKVNEPK